MEWSESCNKRTFRLPAEPVGGGSTCRLHVLNRRKHLNTSERGQHKHLREQEGVSVGPGADYKTWCVVEKIEYSMKWLTKKNKTRMALLILICWGNARTSPNGGGGYRNALPPDSRVRLSSLKRLSWKVLPLSSHLSGLSWILLQTIKRWKKTTASALRETSDLWPAAQLAAFKQGVRTETLFSWP